VLPECIREEDYPAEPNSFATKAMKHLKIKNIRNSLLVSNASQVERISSEYGNEEYPAKNSEPVTPSVSYPIITLLNRAIELPIKELKIAACNDGNMIMKGVSLNLDTSPECDLAHKYYLYINLVSTKLLFN
jgi:hypothetical protein